MSTELIWVRYPSEVEVFSAREVPSGTATAHASLGRYSHVTMHPDDLESSDSEIALRGLYSASEAALLPRASVLHASTGHS